MKDFEYNKVETPSGIQHRFYFGYHGFWILESEKRISVFCSPTDPIFQKMVDNNLVKYQGTDTYQKSFYYN